ncbi:Ribosomal RNA large subunit methyltransferase I [Gammaproteobacteria bacterium]
MSTLPLDQLHARVVLKSGRERSLLNRHPWVFSGAVMKVEGDPQAGGIVAIHDATGHLLGRGFYNPHSQIRLRLLTFGSEPVNADLLAARLTAAAALRSRFLGSEVTALRLVHAEGDGLPGLVVDRYGSVLVVQLHTLGMTRLRPLIVDLLCRIFTPTAIVERSPALKEEGVTASSSVLWGNISPHYSVAEITIESKGADRPKRLEVVEHGVCTWVDVLGGQKTGLFLDQRDNRRRVAELAAASRGARLLNCFSYTGGFSLHAARQGAITTSVEVSATAQSLAKENFVLNGMDPADHRFETADAFDWLRRCTDRYDLVVLDPPAFVKHRTHLEQGSRAYKDINRLGLRLLEPGGLLLTCSCSAHVDWDLFQKILYAAAREADQSVQVLARYSQPLDHPFNLYHPEGEYLKTFLLRVGM